MADYDKDYPKETSFDWWGFNEENVSDCSKMISGKRGKDLEKKFEDFFSCASLDNRNIDYSKFKKKEADFSKYFVQRNFGSGWIDPFDSNIYFDSFYSYLLGKDLDIIAICSFEPRPNALMIGQIQGIKGNSEALSEIRYPDLFLDIFYNDFRGLNISEGWVLPYSRNSYSFVRENFQNTKKRQYDIPAKRQGFVYNEEKGLFVKDFSQ